MAVSDTLPWCRLDYHTQEWDSDFRANLKQLDSKKPLILCGDLNVTYQKIANRTAHTLKHSWSSSIVILFLLILSDLANPKGNTKTAGIMKEEREGFGHSTLWGIRGHISWTVPRQGGSLLILELP